MSLQSKKKKREEAKKAKFLQKPKMPSLVDSLPEAHLLTRQVYLFDNCSHCVLQTD